MQREFGKRTYVRPPPGVAAEEPTPAPKPSTGYQVDRQKSIVAIVLTFVIVGGMFFVLPKLGQCEGSRGALGLDWCRMMKAGVEGAVHGVAAGAGRR